MVKGRLALESDSLASDHGSTPSCSVTWAKLFNPSKLSLTRGFYNNLGHLQMQQPWANKNHTEHIKCLLIWLTWQGAVSLVLEHSSKDASESWLQAAAPFHFSQGGDVT